jgi:hypothetical protein
MRLAPLPVGLTIFCDSHRPCPQGLQIVLEAIEAYRSVTNLNFSNNFMNGTQSALTRCPYQGGAVGGRRSAVRRRLLVDWYLSGWVRSRLSVSRCLGSCDEGGKSAASEVMAM